MENIYAVNDHRGRGRSPSCQENRGSLCYVANFPCRISCSHVGNHLDILGQVIESYRPADSVCLDEIGHLHGLSFTVSSTLSHWLTNACEDRTQPLLLSQYREGTTLGTEATNDFDCFALTFVCIKRHP